VTGGTWSPWPLVWTSSSIHCLRSSAATVEKLVNQELAAARPVEISFLPRGAAVQDDDLIRTKVRTLELAIRPPP
jgi:hypothetical protein